MAYDPEFLKAIQIRLSKLMGDEMANEVMTPSAEDIMQAAQELRQGDPLTRGRIPSAMGAPEGGAVPPGAPTLDREDPFGHLGQEAANSAYQASQWTPAGPFVNIGQGAITGNREQMRQGGTDLALMALTGGAGLGAAAVRQMLRSRRAIREAGEAESLAREALESKPGQRITPTPIDATTSQVRWHGGDNLMSRGDRLDETGRINAANKAIAKADEAERILDGSRTPELLGAGGLGAGGGFGLGLYESDADDIMSKSLDAIPMALAGGVSAMAGSQMFRPRAKPGEIRELERIKSNARKAKADPDIPDRGPPGDPSGGPGGPSTPQNQGPLSRSSQPEVDPPPPTPTGPRPGEATGSAVGRPGELQQMLDDRISKSLDSRPPIPYMVSEQHIDNAQNVIKDILASAKPGRKSKTNPTLWDQYQGMTGEERAAWVTDMIKKRAKDAKMAPYMDIELGALVRGTLAKLDSVGQTLRKEGRRVTDPATWNRVFREIFSDGRNKTLGIGGAATLGGSQVVGTNRAEASPNKRINARIKELRKANPRMSETEAAAKAYFDVHGTTEGASTWWQKRREKADRINAVRDAASEMIERDPITGQFRRR